MRCSVRVSCISSTGRLRDRSAAPPSARSAPRAFTEPALPTRFETLSVGSDPHRCSRADKTMIRATATLRRTSVVSAVAPRAPRTVSLIGAPQQFGQLRGG